MKTGYARIDPVAISEPTPDAEEKVASLFQPDILLPAQYFETFRRKAHLEPEKRLMLAILEDAIDCFQDNVLAQGGRKKKLFREAEEWILAENNDWLFSFENICEILGFNPRYVRQGLIRRQEAKLVRRPKAKIYGLISRVERRKGRMHKVKGTRHKDVELGGRPMVRNKNSIKIQPGKEKDHADGTIFSQDNPFSFDSCPNHVMERSMRHCPAATREVAL